MQNKKKKSYVFLDAEYFNTSEEIVEPVCVSLRYDDQKETHWLHQTGKQWKNIIAGDIIHLAEQGYIFVSYNVIAEGRFLQSIGLDPVDFQWVDIYLEYKQLLNQNHDLQYGRQLIKGKKIRTFPPKPKYQQTKEEKMRVSNAKAETGLGAACFKLLNVVIDNERKNKMRDIIISGDAELIEKHKEEIMEYCDSDTEYLEPLFKKMVTHYKKLLPASELKNLFEYMSFRSEFAARTANMESLGIPFHEDWTRSLGVAIPYIKKSIQEEINRNFPDLKPFRWNKRENRYSMRQKVVKEWISKQPFADRWQRTDKGDFSLSLDAWTQHFHYKYSYPSDCLGAQMIRMAKTETSLRGFAVRPGKRSFWDDVGSDSRSRPFFNIYGSQTGRSQPGSTGFLFLKSAWTRALAVPPSGWAYAAVDFKSQEFLIGGLESGDMNMIKAYQSGDVYMWFATKAKAAPEGATKKTHGFIRDKFKSTVLGMQYRMGAASLAVKLTQDTGVPHTEEDAQDLIDLFNEIFAKYADWCEDTLDDYYMDGYLKTRDGWFMFGDNDNDKSITNFKVQGAGGGILRYSVRRAQEAGLLVPQTLHDATYILYPVGELEHIDTLMEAMDKGFRDYYKGHPLEKYANVGLDPQTWSMEYEDGVMTTPGGLEVPTQKIYIDGRGKEEYKNFNRYFHMLEEMSIL